MSQYAKLLSESASGTYDILHLKLMIFSTSSYLSLFNIFVVLGEVCVAIGYFNKWLFHYSYLSLI